MEQLEWVKNRSVGKSQDIQFRRKHFHPSGNSDDWRNHHRKLFWKIPPHIWAEDSDILQKSQCWVVHFPNPLSSCVFAAYERTYMVAHVRYLISFSSFECQRNEEHYDWQQALTKCLCAIRFGYIMVKATHIFKLSQLRSRVKIHRILLLWIQHCFCFSLYVYVMSVVTPSKLSISPRKKERK